MNSRERILAAINHQPYDRVPTDIWATPEIWRKLANHFGSTEKAMKELHIDGMAGVGPEYIGPSLPSCEPDEHYDIWGCKHKKQTFDGGEYYEQSFFPLSEASTIDDLEKYNWLQADWFNYDNMRASATKQREDKVVQCGYMAMLYYHTVLRGMENALMDPHEDADFTHHLLGKLCDTFINYHRKMFETCDGLIDIAQVTDDLGSQAGPLISMNTFREFYKPYMQRCIDLCKEFGIHVFHHDDGAMSEFLPDLIEMGIEVLNPVQWNCPGMDIIELKKKYGNKITFHGAVENQSILPFGTPEEVRAEVRNNIDILAADNTGYILASCHNMQANTPIENIIAMYDEAYIYGKR